MKNTLTTILLFVSLLVFGQNTINQVLILNEGYYDYMNDTIMSPVTIGSYDVINDNYSTVNTLNGMRFASDIVISNNYYYVAADTKIFKFDLNTHQEIASVNCDGVRNLAIYNDKLIATRGEYLTIYGSYLHVYNSLDLQLQVAIDTNNGPKYASQNIVIDGSNAYIAVNNAYEWMNEKGIVGILDLNTLSYGNEIDLGLNGKNPDNMIISNGFIYTVNNKDWTGSSVSKINISNNTLSSTVDISSMSTGCGTSTLRDDNLVYQISQGNSLNEFNLNNMSNTGTIGNYNLNFYAISQNPVDGNFYASNTDFFSYGKIYIYDANNNEILNFSAGIAPGKIIFDTRSNTGILNKENTFSFYPNPTTDLIKFNEKINGAINIYNIVGELIISKNYNNASFIDVTSLNKGKYIIEYKNNNLINTVSSFVKL